MAERVLDGTPASPGVALGPAWLHEQQIASTGPVPPAQRERECDTARTALHAAAEGVRALAGELDPHQAEIIETGALIAEDPALAKSVEAAILVDGLTAEAAIVRAAESHADAIAALGDELLAARADDVRSLGRRAAAIATGRPSAPPGGADVVLIGHDLGPADVAELAPSLAGVALSGGAATSHAAIVARSLGIPMVTELGEPLADLGHSALVVLDGAAGTLVDAPSSERVQSAAGAMDARRAATQRAHALRDQPARTIDGVRIPVLANVASAEEVAVALRAGAEGVGLLRTELAFLDALQWPSEQQHLDALEPVLAGLGARPAIVRVLDFGADKAPPFLRETRRRGLQLLLAHREHLTDQLRAILVAARDRDVKILLPMVSSAAEVAETRELMRTAAIAVGIDRPPPLGAMIETPAAVRNAASIAASADFLSVGTNDLTATTLGADRFATSTARPYDPRVLRAIAASREAAREAKIEIEVCGEAASDPIMVPLLVGLGIDQLSVGASRVGPVRDWIRRLDAGEALGLARSALTMDDAEEVAWAVRPLAAEHALTG